MSDCTTTQSRFSAYLDGELSAPDRARIDQHLGACAACQEALADFQALDGLLSDTLGGKLPSNEQLAERILNGLEDRATILTIPQKPQRWAMAFVATAAAVLVAVGIWTNLNPDTPMAPELGKAIATFTTHSNLPVTVRRDGRIVRPVPGHKTSLRNRDIFENHSTEPLNLNLPGRALVDVDAGSSVALLPDGLNVLGTGRVFCRVRKHSPTAPFRVYSGNAVVTVVGTMFEVAVDGDALRVAVLEGVVKVTEGARTIHLKANEIAYLGNGQLTKSSNNALGYLTWLPDYEKLQQDFGTPPSITKPADPDVSPEPVDSTNPENGPEPVHPNSPETIDPDMDAPPGAGR